jgi:hypothetical protein
MNEVVELRKVLAQVRKCLSKEDFCGFGVVLYSDISGLPISSLCCNRELPDKPSLAESIAECSKATDFCHDGFHFVNPSWDLTHRNQYFAPYISKPRYNSSKPIGARFLVAQYGSELQQVICTGLVSQKEEVLVFVDGVPV